MIHCGLVGQLLLQIFGLLSSSLEVGPRLVKFLRHDFELILAVLKLTYHIVVLLFDSSQLVKKLFGQSQTSVHSGGLGFSRWLAALKQLEFVFFPWVLIEHRQQV